MFIKPKAGKIVSDPEGGVLPEQGRDVEASQYWYRRIIDGDVEEVTPQINAEDATITKEKSTKVKE